MSRWIDEVQNHQVFDDLAELRKCLSSNLVANDEKVESERRRLKKLVDSAEAILRDVDPEMAPIEKLRQLSDQLRQSIIPATTQFKNTGDYNSLVSANDRFSSLLPILGEFASFRRNAPKPEFPSGLEQHVDEFTEKIARKHKTADEQLNKIEETIEYRKQDLSEIEKQVETHKREVNSQILEWQKQFSEAQENRLKAFNTWLSDISKSSNDDISGLFSKLGEETTEKKADFDNQITDYMREAQKDRDSIRELLRLTANDSTAGSYVKNANSEGRAALIWRLASVFFIICGAVWLLYSYIASNGNISWETALLSLPLTGVLIYGATICGQQSTKHRNVEIYNRRFALEMAAIDPYLESLSDDERREIKKDLTKQFFGSNKEDETRDIDTHVTERILKQVGEHIIKPLTDIVKAKN